LIKWNKQKTEKDGNSDFRIIRPWPVWKTEWLDVPPALKPVGRSGPWAAGFHPSGEIRVPNKKTPHQAAFF
jgi:hypothetical protein